MAFEYFSFQDRLLAATDNALKTLSGSVAGARVYPGGTAESVANMDEAQKAQAAALMRVNHVGEICAQALYQGQALVADDPEVAKHLIAAAKDEGDHLHWSAQRVRELGGRTSLLAPVWYAGAFAIGVVAGKAGVSRSLGFVAETEKQVEAHLNGHLDRLPEADRASRAVVSAMRDDEINHRVEAEQLGAQPLPLPARLAMKVAAKVMTTVAAKI